MLELFRNVFAPPRDLILLLAAGWVGLALADKRARQTTFGEKTVDTVVGAMVLAFLLGGRLLYAAAHLTAFMASPMSLASLNLGLFDAWGGAACAGIAAAIVMQRKRLPAWQMLDLLAPFLAALGVGLALLHVASGAAFGKETNLPWAINLWGAQRHPTQTYELIAATVTLGIVWFYAPRADVPGKTFLTWAALVAGSRLIVEGFRGDSTLVLSGFRLAQIAAWIVLAAALVGLEVLHGREARAARASRVEGPVSQPTAVPARTAKRQRAASGKNSAE